MNNYSALSTMTEEELRAYEVPSLSSLEDLEALLNTLTQREQDYGSCVYSVSIAATAAFNYMAKHLGITGFQASCADLDVVRRVRLLKGPFALFKLEDALFPQYDLQKNFTDWLHNENSRKWLRENAQKKLDEYEAKKGTSEAITVAPLVLGHWVHIAAQK